MPRELQPVRCVKFDRFSFSRAGSATPRVVERVPTADVRTMIGITMISMKPGFVYYIRALPNEEFTYSQLLRAPPLSLSFSLLLSVYFRVFYLAGHCCGHALTTLFTVPPSSNRHYCHRRLPSLIPLRFDTAADFFPIGLLTADRRIPFETCSMEV